MRIELCEDNGVLNGGKPTLVIVLIDGKTRVPYPADKTIQQLYEDVYRMLPTIPFKQPEIPQISTPTPIMNTSIGSIEIEREDMVKCVKVIKREIGMDLNNTPKMGGIYRVLDIHKAGGEVIGYDVLDDVANNKIRMPVFKDEVALHQKFVKPAPRIEVLSVTKLCACGEISAIPLNEEGSMYIGPCSKCSAQLVEKRSFING